MKTSTTALASLLSLCLIASGAAQNDGLGVSEDDALQSPADSATELPPPPPMTVPIEKLEETESADSPETATDDPDAGAVPSEPANVEAGPGDADPVGLTLEFDAREQIVVESVGSEGLAADAGLKPGDIILSVDGEIFVSERALVDYLNENADSLERIRVLREGEKLTLVIHEEASEPAASGRPALGIRFPRGSVIRVVDVVEGSPAYHAGVMEGDIVSSFGGERFDSTDAFIDAVAEENPEETVELILDRNGRAVVVNVALSDWDDVYDSSSSTVTTLRPDLDGDDAVVAPVSRHGVPYVYPNPYAYPYTYTYPYVYANPYWYTYPYYWTAWNYNYAVPVYSGWHYTPYHYRQVYYPSAYYGYYGAGYPSWPYDGTGLFSCHSGLCGWW
ncbi:MAG: PDZ domain-containing protein [Planctomycetota bacterium]|nr:MAG: PDZ domain-containing protein [Planctomycetota bacterium]